jgi:hypothetical protein
MNKTLFLISETDLASRRSAAVLRDQIEPHLSNGAAVIDFGPVESISESYADELFGVLVAHYSLSWVFSRIQVVGASPAVVRTITQAIRYRLEKGAANSVYAASGIKTVVRDAVQKHELAFSH